MDKIPTLFVRNEQDRRYVTTEVTPGCEWVLAGEGVCTRKYDGTCLMFDGDAWWSRREVKPGKAEPSGFVALSTDENTGKTIGWEPVAQSSFHGAFSTIPASMRPTTPGTYELIGPKVNGNPENAETHRLVPHGHDHLGPSIRTYEQIRDYLLACTPPIEGFVYHHPDGRMVKIKRRDFR